MIGGLPVQKQPSKTADNAEMFLIAAMHYPGTFALCWSQYQRSRRDISVGAGRAYIGERYKILPDGAVENASVYRGLLGRDAKL